MLRKIVGLLEMMDQFPSTFVGAKGRAWVLKTMMRAKPTKIIFSLHLCTVEIEKP